MDWTVFIYLVNIFVILQVVIAIPDKGGNDHEKI